MATERADRSRVDERAMGAGTTVRFALLVVLMLVASGSMMLNVANRLSDSADWGCALAAGWDPDNGTDQATMVRIVGQASAHQACVARYAPPPPWWVPLVGPALLLAMAGVLFFGLSAWKARRGRVVPLEMIDRDGDVRRLLEGFVATAGLARAPRFVVDPVAASTGAVVFGNNRRPTVCLHVGLLVRRFTEPEGFRAVLLHELAHIRNGDVTLTYATVAVWRVFLAAVLLPDVVWYVTQFIMGPRSPLWPTYLPGVTRGLVLAVVMVVLVYLARSDVLRNREVYADLAAVRWGADPRGWAITTPVPAGSALRRALGSFLELWRTHPRWDLRRDSLADPAPLFGVRALPMFLTGAAAALINNYVWHYLKQYGLAGRWLDQAVSLVAAGLVTGVVGIALWRAVAHAVLTARRVPSGVQAGVWLGFGIALGELVAGQEVIYDWLPARPQFLLFIVLAGAVFTWWVTQCAQLWVRTWRGRTIRPAMLLGLTAACLVLSSWFAWWHGGGALLVAGWPFDSAAFRHMLQQAYPGPAADHLATLSAIAVVIPMMATVTKMPLVLPAVTVLWVVPLLAWTVRPATAALRWARGAMRDIDDAEVPRGEALPPLRRVLLPGLLGGVSCWVAVVGIQAYMHTWQPASEERGGLDELLQLAWVFVALTAATAATAAALASRYRLLVTLIVAETAAMVGFAGVFVLVSSDGCVQPLSVFKSSCGWRPTLVWPNLEILVTPALVLTTIAAITSAAVVSVCRRVLRPGARQSAPARPPGATIPDGVAARRLGVGVLCAVAVGIAVPEVMANSQQNSRGSALPISQVVGPVVDAPVSAQTRQFQVAAWKRYGGGDLLHRFADDVGRLVALLEETHGKVDDTRLRSSCLAIGKTARDAGGYFRVPDPQVQQLWQTFIIQAQKAGQDCEHAADRQNSDLLHASLLWIEEAMVTAKSVAARTDAVVRGGTQIDNSPVTTQAKELAPADWRSHGGGDLLHRFGTVWDELITFMDQAQGRVDVTRVRPFCAAISQIAQEADGYFRVHDPLAQQRWQTFITQARKAGQDCEQALNELNNDLFSTSLQKIEEAAATAKSVDARIDVVARGGG
ncbi:MAG TPA: M48 family metalloprotease [Pseudonocardiaceae bacterium]|nr:M48 family metalloprotease [Pseudonocardiaceae bacterium]